MLYLPVSASGSERKRRAWPRGAQSPGAQGGPSPQQERREALGRECHFPSPAWPGAGAPQRADWPWVLGPPRVGWQAAARWPGSHSTTQSAFPASVCPEIQAGRPLQTCSWSIRGEVKCQRSQTPHPFWGPPLEDGAGQGLVPRGGCGQKVAQSRAVMGPWGRLSSRSSCALGLPTAVGTTLAVLHPGHQGLQEKGQGTDSEMPAWGSQHGSASSGHWARGHMGGGAQ